MSRRWDWNPFVWSWWTYTYPDGATVKVRGPLTITTVKGTMQCERCETHIKDGTYCAWCRVLVLLK